MIPSEGRQIRSLYILHMCYLVTEQENVIATRVIENREKKTQQKWYISEVSDLRKQFLILVKDLMKENRNIESKNEIV